MSLTKQFVFVLEQAVTCDPLTVKLNPNYIVSIEIVPRSKHPLYILITKLMHWLLFIHKILFSSTCFESQVLIFRRIQLYTCSIWYRHSLREFVVACRYTAWVRHPPTTFPLQSVLTQAVYRQATTNSRRELRYHMLHVYNCILLKMSTWGSKHEEENNILWINNNQCMNLVINM